VYGITGAMGSVDVFSVVKTVAITTRPSAVRFGFGFEFGWVVRVRVGVRVKRWHHPLAINDGVVAVQMDLRT
jgi:hypothetical protein